MLPSNAKGAHTNDVLAGDGDGEGDGEGVGGMKPQVSPKDVTVTVPEQAVELKQPS